MAKPFSDVAHVAGRLVKAMVGVLLIPPVVGLVLGIDGELKSLASPDGSYARWFLWGMTSYVGVHLLLYKPRGLFRFSHRLLARLAVWLFGGQVTTVGAEDATRAKTSGKSKGKSANAARGSTLVVLSPYVVPLYVILISLGAWLLLRWITPELVVRPAAFLIGASLALHITMTADDLQQDRGRFPLELYVMALAISSFMSLLVAAMCLPLVIPEFEWMRVFAQAMAHAEGIYTAAVQMLFR